MVRTLWDQMREMQERIDSLFADFFTGEPWSGRAEGLLTGPNTCVPAMNYRHALTDIREDDKEYVATVELPGVEKGDIHVNATEDGVEIKVEKKDEQQSEDKKGITRMERSYAGFYRFISTPGADPSKVKAHYKNGILELRIPRSEKRAKGQLVKVE